MKYNIPIVRKDISVDELIRRIDRSKYSIAFITDNDDSYISQTSIYKLRRLLLSGLDSSDSISSVLTSIQIKLRENEVSKPKSVKSILIEMETQGVEFCPIINSNGKIIDIYSKNDLSNLISETFKTGSISKRQGNINNILVVGGAGYLGSVLIRELLDKGYYVRVLDKFIYGRNSLKDIKNNKLLEIKEGDIRNIETIISSLEDIDAVILLAAVVGDPASKARPTQTIETNLLAAQTFAAACKSQYINRFIYASTCSVYGKGDDIIDENSPLNPVSLYARTKIASEQSIMKMANDSFSPTILRMGTLYGYSPRMRFDLVVNTMTLKAFSERIIQVFGGEQWRPLLHVKDAAKAYIQCLESPIDRVGNQIFNLGSDEQNYRIFEIANIIKDALSDDVKIVVEKSSTDARDYKVSFEKIRNRLDFNVQHNVSEAAKEIYENLKNNIIKNPLAKVYYNHYFDSTEE